MVAFPTVATAAADPNALWTIVHDKCVPNQQLHDDPAPCALVDLSGGKDAGQQTGSAVLKDLVGANQFLLIPTARIAGIESPEILAPGAGNYFAAAWRARTFTDQRAGWTLPRDWVSLAINSVFVLTFFTVIHWGLVRPYSGLAVAITSVLCQSVSTMLFTVVAYRLWRRKMQS